MKKIILFLLLCCFAYFSADEIFTKDHDMYQELSITSGKRLEEYSDGDLKKAYKEVDVRKFWGWRTKKVANKVDGYFTYETIFSYYNDGYTAIDYSYKSEVTDLTKFSIAATGSIGFDASKSGTGFKNGLNSSLKIEGKYEENKTAKESISINLKVDPGTQVNLSIKGEGKLTNGVAAHYVFWRRTIRGGFEYFEVTTQYQNIEKIKI